MSLSRDFLYRPKVDTSEEIEDSDKLYKGGVRGKRILCGILILVVMYLLAIGNLITLVTVSSSLRLNSFGSLYFSFVTHDTLRLHRTLHAERILLEAGIHSDGVISLASLSDILLNAGTIISDDLGLMSVPSFLSIRNDSIFSSTFTFRTSIINANSSNLQFESDSNSVAFHSEVQARNLTITSGLRTQNVSFNNPTNTLNLNSLSVSSESGIKIEGDRGVKISSTALQVSSNNATNIVSPRINLSSLDLFKISTSELSNSTGSYTPQLRLCSCNTGALFLLSTSSNSCTIRGPVGSLC